MTTASDLSTVERPAAECDIIMKGGITSGVVYPGAIRELASRYRFRGVGGTSAGAIAAAGAAAAEYGRSSGGFDRLALLPPKIGRDLRYLFQPGPGTRHLYDLMMVWIEPDKGRVKKLFGTVTTLIAAHWLTFVGTLLVVAAVGAMAVGVVTGSFSSLVGLAVGGLFVAGVAFAVALILAAWRFVGMARRELPRNGFGISNGLSSDEKRGNGVTPLTPWVADLLDDLAGRDPNGPPLTFGDLWGKPAVDVYRNLSGAERSAVPRSARQIREIELEMMTSNLTFGRASQLPFTDDTYMWCETSWEGKTRSRHPRRR